MPDQLDAFTTGKSKNHPRIYAYAENNPNYAGLLKIGFTVRDVEKRVAAQYPTQRPGGKPYTIVFNEPAMYEDGGSFDDHAIHRVLRKKGIANPKGEWFRCTVEQVRAAWLAVRKRFANEEDRDQDFSMRPEQQAAVEKTQAYFESAKKEGIATPKFLWNAKMRFGKTFATYQLAKAMKLKRILILTFKPAVQSAWQEDLCRHIDFENWQFISRDASEYSLDEQYHNVNPQKPVVCFGSFQDFLGVNKETGGIKPKNKWVHASTWDLVVFDEYHFGAWKDSAKKLFEQENEESLEDTDTADTANALNESWLPIKAERYLYLSGTPFRALNSGEFIEEQIYNWTYADEQKAKAEWKGADNPYAALPRLVLLTYQLPENITAIARQGEFNEFDLNIFFEAAGKGKDAKFIHEEYVQKWLDLIRGAYMPTTAAELKLGRGKPAMPFADTRLLQALSHTLWFLPNVASCEAMGNLLRQKQNSFYHDYNINVCAGAAAGIGLAALAPVLKSMNERRTAQTSANSAVFSARKAAFDPLTTRTITLTCGKLTTGVTVKPWTGVFMLRNLQSPETYFQTAFRVQSPWEISVEGGKKKFSKKIAMFLILPLSAP